MKKHILLCTLMLTTTQVLAKEADSQDKMSFGKQMVTVLKSLRYILGPTFNGPRRQARITSTEAYQKWLVDLKHLTDEFSGTSYEDETQFQYGVEVISDRLKADQQPLSGYFHSRKKNKSYLKRDRKMFEALVNDPHFFSAYSNFVADAKNPQNRSRGPIWASSINYKVPALEHLESHRTLKDYLKNGKDLAHRRCAEVCPEGAGILRLNRDPLKVVYGREDAQLSFTSFRNIPEDFDTYIKKQFGFCWGHSSVLYKFKRYAIFRPELPQDGPETVRTKLKHLIRESRVVEFNGYANLQELTDASLNENNKRAVMEEIAREWGRNALTIKSMTNLGPAKKALKLKDYVEVYNDIVKRILANEMVQIKFNVFQVQGWSHIVNAYGFQETPEEYRIYVQDPNIFPKDIVPSTDHRFGEAYLAIKKTKHEDGKGDTYYLPLKNVPKLQGETRLGLIEVTPEGKIAALETTERYQAICREVTQCQED